MQMQDKVAEPVAEVEPTRGKRCGSMRAVLLALSELIFYYCLSENLPPPRPNAQEIERRAKNLHELQ
jgi:hypothetical protein